ncbi:MAG: Fe-S cluster assembly protein SufD [Gammaproteobacteria bacterium]|nr:Fe-S cluster assembly protein SufD [Gammaproteobacteria bacterium]
MINHLNAAQSEQQRQWFQTLITHSDSISLGQHLPWVKHLQNKARQELQSLPLVQRKQELWRYSHAEKLFKQPFYPQTNNSDNCYQAGLESEATLSTDSFKLVFVNGRYNATLSSTLVVNNELAEGVIVGNLHAVLQSHANLVMQCFNQTARQGEDVFSALNTALMSDGVFIYIDQQVTLPQPIEVLYLSGPAEKSSSGQDSDSHTQESRKMANLRNVIILQAGAKLSLIERFSGEKDFHYFNNNLTNVVLEQGASIKHSILQDESNTAFHLNSLFLSLFKDSTYQGQHIALGSSWSRTNYTAKFKGTGATCELKGLYTVANQQLNDVHLDINHAVPGCTSSEFFKGILYGEGKAVFDGHVLVEKQSQFSDASMKNDNLMLTENAEVNTKPQLEIYADNVKCSHGTTVGQIDEQQLFYLRSRGIEESRAKKLLCLGYASEIMDAINEPLFQKQVKSILDVRLNEGLLTSSSEKSS